MRAHHLGERLDMNMKLDYYTIATRKYQDNFKMAFKRPLSRTGVVIKKPLFGVDFILQVCYTLRTYLQ